MARLPTVGGDNGNWGDILNTFLQISHNADGTLKNIARSVKEYGAVGDGKKDDTQAFIDALTSNDIIRIPGNNQEIYRIGHTELTGLTRYVLGEGNPTLRMISKEGCLSLKGGWSSINDINPGSFSVVSINTVEPGESANSTYVTQFTVNANLTLTRGQRVKIVSDDNLDDSVDGGTYTGRKGEYAIVALDTQGSGGTTLVTVTARLQDTYTTNPRFAVCTENYYVLENLTFDADPELPMQNEYSAALEILATQGSRLCNVTFKNIQGRGVYNAAFGTQFDNLIVSNLNNRPTKSQYGYGIDDNGTGSIVTNLKAYNVRHGYTTNTFAITANTNHIERYGRPRDSVISDSVGFGTQSAAFDTHETADNIRFVNCHAIGDYRGADSGGNGFTARGSNIEFVGCTAKKCSSGFVLSVKKNVWMRNCQAIDISDIAVSIEGRTAYGGLVNYIGYKIEDCYLEAGAATGTTVEQGILIGSSGYSFEIEINNTTIKMLGATANSKAIPMSATKLRLNNVTIDLSAHTGTGVSSLFLRDSSCEIYGKNIRIFGGSSVSATVLNAAASNTSPLFIENIYYTHASVAPAVFVSTNFTAARVGYKQEIGATRTSSAFVLQAASAGATLTIANSPDNVINLRFNGSNGNVTIAALPSGHFPGQVLNLTNSSNGSVTCPNPDFTLPSAAGIGASFYWDGAWRTILTSNRIISPSTGKALVNGTNNDIALTNPRTFTRITGPTSAFSLGGFTSGVDGAVLKLFNTTSQQMTILNEASSSTAANRITTLTGADVVLRSGTSFATFIYDGTTSRWILTGYN